MPKPTAAASGLQVPPMIDVVSVKHLEGYKLRVGFSDGSVGVHDFSSTAARDGEMVQPLKDPAFFSGVFIELGVGVLNAAVYGGGILARPGESTTYSYRPASRELLEAITAMDAVCARAGFDLATAALQFSLRDPRVDATVVGITSERRISSLIASAGVDIPSAVWDELERLVPPASTWLDARDRP